MQKKLSTRVSAEDLIRILELKLFKSFQADYLKKLEEREKGTGGRRRDYFDQTKNASYQIFLNPKKRSRMMKPFL